MQIAEMGPTIYNSEVFEYDHDDECIDHKVGMMFSSEETNSCLS